MHLLSYLDTAKKILSAYDGSIPFTAYLKNFFRANKKYGSRDRKMIGSLCYCWFRLGSAYRSKELEEQLLIGQFLCSETSNIFLEQMRPGWNERAERSIPDKFQIIGNTEKVFPFADELSHEIETDLFDRSFLMQPHLFLRIRPGKKQIVLKKLDAVRIEYVVEEENCLRLPNSTRVEDIMEIDEEVVVQDLNSQKVLEPLKSEIGKPACRQAGQNLKISAWDCCAASGGKSILAYDTFSNIQLIVSDIRESILFNLRKRFARAGIKNYKSFVADLSSPDFKLPTSDFRLILCDAPCSGSGTWGRTPEQLLFFKKEKIKYYQNLQKRISGNASKALASGGYFVYITCSVFKKENEDVVNYLQEQTDLKLINQQYHKGYTLKADTLFAALFQR